ncbi:MAPEG family protein [Legionella taurinensis]|uniref:MAPEG family protein n=1 Tax=Legionella taurinensis TaxID=70611 RepID=A0A3A5LHU7_9GAMM|nr:MAPEG family protein [Legionella taurinensis]MDX1838415.1 MAPEG family protein [Legionella taurinensis]PUT39167.1 MAPEG family protein [Legionella taurinensis]PUT39792.1 MAPEG family protein [Legionella taurinensis]PUT43624.1 MAPEG family protein [Legionella taurinensis]PUT45279.1 MAPEG family protein [Legionella taurinensis]
MELGYLLVLGYCTWTLILLFSIGLLRVSLTVSGQRRANAFSPFGDEVSPFANRLCRAHANCYENLPVVLGVVFVAAMTQQLSVINPLALTLLTLRVLQSIVHVLSTRVLAVLVRFVFFVGQVLILFYWIIRLFSQSIGSV